MPTPPLPVAELHRTLLAIVEHGSVSEAARQTGAARPALNHRAQQIRTRWPGLLPEGQGNGLWAAGLAVPTLEEMEASDLHPRAVHRRAVADLRSGSIPAEGFAVTKHTTVTDKHGDIVREFIRQSPEPGPEFEMPPGFKIGKQTIAVDRDDRIERRWIKLRENEVGRGLVEALQEAFASYAGKAALIPAPSHAMDELLTIYPLADLHFGMQAWGKETGADYDIKIATDIAVNAVSSLVSKSEPSKHAILLGLGDLFHANDQTNVTPRSKHQLDVDSRWEKTFRLGAELLVRLIDLLETKHETVEVVLLPGNHDESAAPCLRVALSLFYRSVDRVQVHEGPGLHWYSRFGKCLFGATHGHTMKPDRMGGMMAADCPQDWGETLFRHMFFGHIHTDTMREVPGAKVESFNTLAARDAYAHGGGWRSGRAMSAITYHRELGEIGRHRVEVAQARPRVRVLAGRAA